VVYNAADEVVECIRSVKALVGRFVVVDSAFTANPVPGGVQSTDGTRAVVEEACAGVPLTYIEPPKRLEQHLARDLYLAEIADGEWLLTMDSDEVFYGFGQKGAAPFLAELSEHSTAVSFRVFSTAIAYPGPGSDLTPEQYATLPIHSTGGWQPRLFKKGNGLRHRAGWEGVGWRNNSTEVIGGNKSDAAVIINRHVSQSFEGYQADWAWETRHRTPPPTAEAYS
jgi:hypothetical protein